MDVHSSLSSISHDVYSAELKRVNSAGSVLSFQHLSYAVSTKGGQKTLIDDITVNVCAGELLAVMVSYLVISFICIPLQSANSWYEYIRALLVQVSLSFIYLQIKSFTCAKREPGKSTLLDVMSYRKTAMPGGTVSF